MLNKITVQGRIVHTPELRKTSSGTSVLNLDLACNRSRKDANGEYPTDFFNAVLWGKSAEVVVECLGKGDLIIVFGRMESRKYQDKQGNNRIAWELQAEGFEFCGKKNSDSAAASFETYNTDNTSDFAELADDEDVPF